MSDAGLIALATEELARTRAGAGASASIDGTVVRMPQGLPGLRRRLREAVVDRVRALPGAASTNLQLVGRNGMHKYNNQDHSMLTAMLAVGNIFGERHDLWAVNADDEYHENAACGSRDEALAEQIRAMGKTQPAVPMLLGAPSLVSAQVQAEAHAPAQISARM